MTYTCSHTYLEQSALKTCCNEKVFKKSLGKYELDVRDSVHRDTTMKITTKMHYID